MPLYLTATHFLHICPKASYRRTEAQSKKSKTLARCVDGEWRGQRDGRARQRQKWWNDWEKKTERKNKCRWFGNGYVTANTIFVICVSNEKFMAIHNTM